ncbi:MAG: hypothetical protein ABID04_01920 [Patescibacteria group bacterium]
MKLFCGSSKRNKIVRAEIVHPSDYPKFEGIVPQKVIWATSQEQEAWIFAVFSSRTPFKLKSLLLRGSRKTVCEILVKRELTSDELMEMVYLHVLDGKHFKQVGNSPEWYCLKESLPDLSIRVRKIADLLADWKETSSVEIKLAPELFE